MFHHKKIKKYFWRVFLAVGKSKEEAMNDYITKVRQLQEEAEAVSANWYCHVFVFHFKSFKWTTYVVVL